MALIAYIRASDVRHLVQDINLEVMNAFYVPVFDSFGDLGIGDGDPSKPGAIAAYMDGSDIKVAAYDGDGNWTPVGGSPTSLLTLSADTTIDWQDDEAPDAEGNPSGHTYAQRFGNGFIWTAEYEMPSGPYAGEFTDYRPTVLKSYSSGNLTQVRILDVTANTRIIFK